MEKAAISISIIAILCVCCARSETQQSAKEDGDEKFLELEEAVRFWDYSRVKALIEEGANLNKVEPRINWTPLEFAASSGNIRTTEMLLSAGAQLVVDSSPSEIALGERTTAFMMGVGSGNTAMVQLLLDHGADIHTLGHVGHEGATTALHGSALFGVPHIIEFLLKNGAKIDARSDSGLTPLHMAAIWAGVEVEGDQLAAIDLLLSHGADINAKDDEGRTPFYRAWGKGSLSAALLLYLRDAEIDDDPSPKGLDSIEFFRKRMEERFRSIIPKKPSPKDGSGDPRIQKLLPTYLV